MKTFPLTCCFVALSLTALAQRTELSVFANSGLARYRGNVASSQTSMYGFTNAATYTGYLDQIYGTRPGISFGGGLQWQRVTASDFVYGLQVGADVLRSNIAIIEVFYSPSPATSAPATREGSTGKFTLRNTSVNLNPYLGTRWRKGHYEIDFTFGTDLGYIISLNGRGEAMTDSGLHFSSQGRVQNSHTFDVRPRAGIAVYRKKYGASVSYAHGLVSYLHAIADPSERAVYANVLRLGAHYRL